jgi:glycosyltransferase involved in cell wall biosynthesis
MEQEILLTVGIPCYNEEKYLADTLESILNQDFEKFVVYVCDDCSSDSTVEIAMRYANKDSRIKILKADKRTNFVANWNRSLKICESKYFVWIGGHDILHTQYFQEAIDLLEKDDKIVLAYPMSISIDASGRMGGSADSDIETIGLFQKDALVKVASNLDYCTAIHGIFRSSVLKKIPIKRIVGFDFLIIFLTSMFGEIAKTNDVRFFRRVIREESHVDAEKRWKESGMFETSKFSNFTILIGECLINYKRLAQGSLFNKIGFMNALANLLGAKFNIRKSEIVKIIFKL